MVESKNSALIINPKELGGFLNLSGIPRNSLIGQNKIFGSLVYRYRWFDNDFGLFSSPFYRGASLEYGGVWSDPSISADKAPLYGAGSVFFEWTRLSGLLWLDMEGQNKIMTLSTLLLGPVLNNYP